MFTNKLRGLLLAAISYLILLQHPVYSNFWMEALKVVTCASDSEDETWDGQTKKKEYNHCLPLFKTSGRNGCLKQFDLPTSGYYMNYCAQESLGSNYFNPKIQIKLQKCNFLLCDTQTIDLTPSGECKIVMGPYVLPTYRFCARIASPPKEADTVKKNDKRDADHGYPEKEQKNKVLNFEGAWKNDPDYLKTYKKDSITDKDEFTGEYYQLPKMCAYEDPWAIGLELDIMDNNPYLQPIHKNSSKINSFILFIITILKIGKGLTEGVLVDWWSGNSEEGKEDSGSTKVGKFIKALMSVFGDSFVLLLKSIGDLNRVVNSSLGCVKLPIGPLPPPYLKSLSSESIAFNLVVQQICPKIQTIKDPATKALASSILQNMMTSKGCVPSELDNNFIHNSVRVGINKIIPTCQTLKSINRKLYDQLEKDNKLNTTDQCVNIANLTPGEIKLFNITKYDLITKCTSSSLSAQACFTENNELNKLCNLYGGCDKARVVYGDKFEKGRIATFPNSNLNTELEDMESPEDRKKYSREICLNETQENCQTIWGVNIGKFEDIAVQFPEVGVDQGIYSSPEAHINLHEHSYKFKAVVLDPDEIVYTKPDKDEASKTMVSSDKICAMVMDNTNNYIIDCVTRPRPLSYPTIIGCDKAKELGINCTSTHFKPAMYVKFEYDNGQTKFTTARVIEADTLTSTEDAKEFKNPHFKLAGYDYSSYVTDATGIKMPFSGTHSFNMGTSLYGNYEGGVNPLKKGQSEPIYIDGLEYFNARYIRGGTTICLTSPTKEACPIDKEQCVLVKYANGKNIPCADFKKDLMNKFLCGNSDLKDYKLTKKTYGSKEIEIYLNASNGSGCYRYKNDSGYGAEELCAVQYPGREILLRNFDPYNITDVPNECSADSISEKEIKLAIELYPDKDLKECDFSDGNLVCNELFSDQKTIDFLQAKIKSSKFQYISLETCTPEKVNDDSDPLICYKKLNVYDPNKCALDSKSAHETTQEKSLCADVEAVYCEAVTQASSSTGYATWSQAQAGTYSTGACMEGFTPKSKTSLTRRCIAEFSLNNFTPSNKGVLDTMSKKYGCMKKDCAEADIQLSNFALFDGEEDYFELSSETTENLKKCSFVKTFKLKTKSKGAASALLINTANPSDLAQMEIQIRGVDTNYSLVTTALGDIEELRDLDPTKPQSVALNILTKDKGIVILLNPIKPQLEISISYTLIKQ